jgi:hypothetical protein
MVLLRKCRVLVVRGGDGLRWTFSACRRQMQSNITQALVESQFELLEGAYKVQAVDCERVRMDVDRADRHPEEASANYRAGIVYQNDDGRGGAVGQTQF